jgi:FtsH-binding integral membrane protein
MLAAFRTALFFVYAAITGVTFGFILLSYPPSTVRLPDSAHQRLRPRGGDLRGGHEADLTSMGAYLSWPCSPLVIAMVVNLFLQSATFAMCPSGIAVLISQCSPRYDIQRIARGDVAAEKGRRHGRLRLPDFINLFVSPCFEPFNGGRR